MTDSQMLRMVLNQGISVEEGLFYIQIYIFILYINDLGANKKGLPRINS